MSFAIQGIGTALPEHSMTQQEALALAEAVCCDREQDARALRVLYRRAGVEHRNTVLPHRIALDWIGSNEEHDAPGQRGCGPTTGWRMERYEELAGELALEAAGAALAQAETEPAEITHLVTVSCTGFAAPGVDIELIRRLSLRPTTERVHVGFMGCHGAINGLRVASALAADPSARILLCAVELCSLHYHFRWDPERLLGNALFADGAAAIVGKGANGSAAPWRVAGTGSCLLPDSTEAMSWRIRDHGYEMALSAAVPQLIADHLKPWLSAWLDRHGLGIEVIGSWAVHPGGPRILSATGESLGLPEKALSLSREMLAQRGNMSSPTVLFILEQLRARNARRPCVMLGFGPGLVAEAALVV